MFKIILTGIFLIVCIFGLISVVGSVLRGDKNGEGVDVNISKKTIVTSVVVVLAVITILSATFTVKQGSVAIVSRFGKVMGVKEPGLNFKAPFIDKAYTMITREQTIKFGKDEEFSPLTVSTKDMQTIDLDLTVSNITTDPLSVYKAFTGRQLESLLVPRIKDAVQANVSRYTIEEFVSQRAKLAQDIYNEVKSDFEPYGIVVTNVSITNHDFSDVYEAAVEKIAQKNQMQKEQFFMLGFLVLKIQTT